MIARALEKYIRISDKKLRPLTGMIKGKKVSEALYVLVNLNKKGAGLIRRAVESALSNAQRITEKKLGPEDLYISKLTIDQGPALKRYRAMSMGRAGTIRKRTSHILVELEKLKTNVGGRASKIKKSKMRK